MDAPSSTATTRASHYRWSVALLLGAAIAISYLDRQTLPVAIQAIKSDIPITDLQFSYLNSAFLIAYGLMYAIGGRILDGLGTRIGFAAFMIWWSLACASHGLAQGFAALAVSRLLLGIGEGGGFPAATKAVAEWFPASERSTAMGIINAGTAIGAVLAPPAIAAIIQWGDWRWVFYVTGAIGLAWTAWWLRAYHTPSQHPRISAEELALLSQDTPGSTEVLPTPRWLDLIKSPQVKGLVAAKFLSDSAWYFFLFWMPKYLYDVRGFDIKQVGAYAWIPYAAAGLGCLIGGWSSSRLIASGHSVNWSRKLILGLSALLLPQIFFVTQVPSEWVIVLFSIAFLGQQSWSTLVMVLPTDLFPRQVVGSVAGLVGLGGAMGGVVFGLVVGRILDALGVSAGYTVVFALASCLHVLAFVIILVTIRDVRPLDQVTR